MQTHALIEHLDILYTTKSRMITECSQHCKAIFYNDIVFDVIRCRCNERKLVFPNLNGLQVAPTRFSAKKSRLIKGKKSYVNLCIRGSCLRATEVWPILINCPPTTHFIFPKLAKSIVQNAIKKDIVFHFHVKIKAISANFRLTSYRCSITSVTSLYQYLLK